MRVPQTITIRFVSLVFVAPLVGALALTAGMLSCGGSPSETAPTTLAAAHPATRNAPSTAWLRGARDESKADTKPDLKSETKIAAATPAADPAGNNGRVAVMILMLPQGAEDPARRGEPRTYKVSLSPDLANATVEVDGRAVADARVQRLTPTEVNHQPDRLAARFARPPVPVAAPAGPALELGQMGGVDGEASAPRTRRRLQNPAMPAAVVTHPSFLNPNGAPIID